MSVRRFRTSSTFGSTRRRRNRVGVEPLEDRQLLATLVALTTANSLVRFDSAAPGTLLGSATPLPITGLQAGETLQGIDFRPASGQLYALGSTSRLYVVNPTTGAATALGTAPFTPAL